MTLSQQDKAARRLSIGGSDAKIIMGSDYKALLQLWKEKRGEAEPENFDGNLVVQLGTVTEELNARWFEREHPDMRVLARQHVYTHPKFPYLTCTSDGTVGIPDQDLGTFEGKFMLPFVKEIEQAAREKHWWQCQHNMMVMNLPKCFLSVITGGGKYFCIEIDASRSEQSLLLENEHLFWFAVKEGVEPKLQGCAAPGPVIVPTRILNMERSNAWAEYAGMWAENKPASEKFEQAKKALKDLVPADVKQARGHGVLARRAKNGNLSIRADVEEEEEYAE